VQKKIISVVLVFFIGAAAYLLWFYLFREEWQENEILNVACVGTYLPIRLSDLQPIGYTISVFEDGSMYMATGVHRHSIWRNSMQLDTLVNKHWTELNEKGYWNKIWRGSIRLEATVWEERVQLSTEDFGRLRELILAIDEHDLSETFMLALTDEFVVNTRKKRCYTQRAGGDERIVALYDELWRVMPIYFDKKHN